MKKAISLYNCDCLEILPNIPDKSIELILTDLPYNVTGLNWDVIIPLEPMWKQLNRIIKDDGAIVLTAVQPFTSQLIMSNKDMFRYTWVWNKGYATGFFNANKMPMRGFEDVVVFYKSLPTYNPQKTKGKPFKMATSNNSLYCADLDITSKRVCDNVTGDRHPKGFIDIQANERGKEHPTQKPVALMEYLIETYSNKGDVVMDITMGSGTTGVAAVKTGRRFIGIEMDNGYFEIAKKRLSDTALNKKHVNTFLEF